MREAIKAISARNAAAMAAEGLNLEDLARMIRTDAQVKRRLLVMILTDVVEQIDGAAFMGIVAQYCQRVGLGAPVEADPIGRLFHKSSYRFGRAMELLLNALETALERDARDLTIDHFTAACAINEACLAAENVFYAATYWLLDPDADLEYPNAGKSSKRRA